MCACMHVSIINGYFISCAWRLTLLLVVPSTNQCHFHKLVATWGLQVNLITLFKSIIITYTLCIPKLYYYVMSYKLMLFIKFVLVTASCSSIIDTTMFTFHHNSYAIITMWSDLKVWLIMTVLVLSTSICFNNVNNISINKQFHAC